MMHDIVKERVGHGTDIGTIVLALREPGCLKNRSDRPPGGDGRVGRARHQEPWPLDARPMCPGPGPRGNGGDKYGFGSTGHGCARGTFGRVQDLERHADDWVPRRHREAEMT